MTWATVLIVVALIAWYTLHRCTTLVEVATEVYEKAAQNFADSTVQYHEASAMYQRSTEKLAEASALYDAVAEIQRSWNR